MSATNAVQAPPRVKPRRALPTLEPFYYLKNFEWVLAAILERYADLLTATESRFIAEFAGVPQRSRALLVRMVMRRGDLFRAVKLNYPEIGDTLEAAQPLIDAGWLADRPPLTVDELQGILNKHELIRALSLPPRHSSWRKSELVAVLKAQFPARKSCEEWFSTDPERVFRLLISPVCERIRLLFFGNYRQTWTEFVTAELQIIHYEKVERSCQSRAFQTREQLGMLEQLQDCALLFEQGVPLEEVLRLLPETINDSDWLEERRQQLLFRIAREHERAGEMPQALAIYARCTYRGARSRLIRLTLRAQDWESSLAVCRLAHRDPESEAELQHVRRVMPRVLRKMGLACSEAYAAPVIPEFDMVCDPAHDSRAVEYRVLEQLASDRAAPSTVRYVENGLIGALFGLLCWPAIFAPKPGAFFHDFHHAPADLSSSHFYRRRQREFADCLSELESDRYRESIWRNFKTKWGIQSPFVRWPAIDGGLIRVALDCFPAAHLRHWCQWILRDVRENRAGFPDLAQFWPKERRYRLIEVKGPGDRIQDNQRRLLQYCIERQMPVAVCHVRWVPNAIMAAPPSMPALTQSGTP